MTSTHRTTQVLIIGGGPTGLVAALCLDRLGVPAILVERRESVHTHPKAHELSARSIEILHELGIGHDELCAHASSFEDGSRILFCDTIGKEFGSIDLAADGSRDKYRRHLAAPLPYLNLSQVIIEELLRARLAGSSCVEVLAPWQWESFAEEEGGVTSRVVRPGGEEQLTIASRFVVCADGAHSRCRMALGVTMEGPERLRDFMSAHFEADLSGLVQSRGKIYFTFAPPSVGNVFIAHDIERRWVFHTAIATPAEKVEECTEAEVLRRIHSSLGRDDIEIRIRSMSHWQMSAQVARRFRVGRAFLAGDAAHRFPPTGGLGMNTGIGDAHNLAWKLAAVLSGRAPDSLLDTYESERRPVVQDNCDESRVNFERMWEIAEAFGVDRRAIERMSERLHGRVVNALPATGQRLVRWQVERYGHSVLARFDKDPVVRERVHAAIAAQRDHFDRIGLDLGYRYREGALIPDGTPEEPERGVSDYVPSTQPGARLPHFWLDARRRARSSHELIDLRRSTLVVGDAVQAARRARRSDGEEAALAAVAERLAARVTSLDEAGVPAASRAATHVALGIEPDGALLVRPDGHIGWRQSRGVTLDAALLESILVEAYR